MRFNSEAYAKTFPRKEPIEQVESVAKKFTPTADKLKGVDRVQPDPQPDQQPDDEPEGEGEGDGTGGSGELDTE